MSDWWDRALAAVEYLAQSGEDFDADDLIALVGHPDIGHTHNSVNSSIGSVFRVSHSRGLIAPTGGVRQSRQPQRHGGLVRMWRGTRQPSLF